MTHCRLTILRLVTAVAQPLGLDTRSFCANHSLQLDGSAAADPRVPWQTFADLLRVTQDSVGGSVGLEAVGVNTCLGFRPYRQLAELYFGLEDLYQITASRVVPEMYGSVLRSTFRRQTDNSFRITLSIDRELPSCFPFWTFMLGQFRALPRHLGLPDAAVDVEFGDHFGEYIIVPPVLNEEEHGPASRIRRGVRDHLLDDLLQNDIADKGDKLKTLSVELAGRTFMRRSISCDPAALQQLLNQIKADLKVPFARLWAYSSDGLLPIGNHHDSTNRARLRRTLWMDARPIGCIDVERESSGDPSAINAELDEHAGVYVERIANLVGSVPKIADAKFSSGAAAIVNEPPIAEPPPSSRGRMRAARNSRVGEIASLWRLTPRQASVMALLVEGLANKEIALRLNCSVGTIENHVTCILRRAKVGSRAALTAAFWGRGA
jgi:DNA-binding CsgD family transcriptional regulator